MPFDEKVADRLREALVNVPNVEEKHMFGGVCFMVNGKMCMGVVKDEIMCRIDPASEEAAHAKTGCRAMDFTGKPMKGYVFVAPEGIKTAKALEYWVNLSLAFNSKAKKSKKK